MELYSWEQCTEQPASPSCSSRWGLPLLFFFISLILWGEKKDLAFICIFIAYYSSYLFKFFFLFGYDSKMEIISALGRWVRRQCSASALQGLIAGLSARFTVSCSATAPARHCLLVKAWSVLINSVSVEAGVQRISGQFDPTCQNCLLITMRLKSCTWAWSAVSPPPPTPAAHLPLLPRRWRSADSTAEICLYDQQPRNNLSKAFIWIFHLQRMLSTHQWVLIQETFGLAFTDSQPGKSPHLAPPDTLLGVVCYDV